MGQKKAVTRMKFVTRQVSGHGRGKLLGFPTINMEIPDSLDAPEGIYASWITIGDHVFKGALHWGPVPVFGQTARSLEVFLIDVSGPTADALDTRSMTVELVKRLRGVQSFPDSKSMVSQIQKDVEDIHHVLS
jgi:riboflavin kinase / FMN adenylyltransferase